MRRPGLLLAMREQWWLVLILFGAFILPQPGYAYSLAYKVFTVDTSAPEFTACKPDSLYLPSTGRFPPEFHCAALCGQDPSCTFITYKDNFCELHWVQIRIGDNSTSAMAELAYRILVEAVAPAVELSSYATVTSSTDLSTHPSFASFLVSGDPFCLTSVANCPCSADSFNQLVKIDLGKLREIKVIKVYRTVSLHETFSLRFKMYIGNTGIISQDKLYTFETATYGAAKYKTYTMKKKTVAQYITFRNYLDANICLCKVMVYGIP